MSNLKGLLDRWGWSLLVMGVIFALSSTPGSDLPNFGSFDYWVKKGSHMLGYGLLALTYRRGLGRGKGRIWLAWLLTMLYAATDEVHQSLVPGRHPSMLDVILFDGTGATIALWWASRIENTETT